MSFIQPPEINHKLDDVPTIFLAGPIQGGPEWQYEVQKIANLTEDSILIASPRKNYKEGEFVYEKQVDWETYYLRQAATNGVIIFWLAKQTFDTPGRSYAQTSRFEIGEWLVKHKEFERANLVIGIEEGFTNERYIRRRFGQDAPDVPILSDLESTVLEAVRLIKEAK